MRLLIAFTFLCFSTVSIAEQTIVPSDRVKTGVKVRASASTSSQEIGVLKPGDSAEFIGEVPRWYRIDHPVIGNGFVSKSWTKLIVPSEDTSQNEYAVYVVDIGTGLAIFVKGPDFTLVYDAGTQDDSKTRFLDFLDVVAPELNRIDHLIVSHAHSDHTSLLTSLLESVQIGEIWDSGVVYASCTYQRFMEAIETENAIYHTAVNDNVTREVQFKKSCQSTGTSATLTFGSRLETGTVPLGKTASMNFLYVDASKRSDINENSLVVMLNLGDTKILLAGDSEGGERKDPNTPPKIGSVEQVLIECCSNEIVADILVVGHHGSKTSSRVAFLNAVSATDYIISSGPYKYSGVQLPDEIIEQTILARSDTRLFKTYENDDACKVNPNKIGSDNDEKPGGCNTIKILIKPNSTREITTLSN